MEETTSNKMDQGVEYGRSLDDSQESATYIPMHYSGGWIGFFASEMDDINEENDDYTSRVDKRRVLPKGDVHIHFDRHTLCEL